MRFNNGSRGTVNLADNYGIIYPKTYYYSIFVDLGYRFNQLMSTGLELRHNGSFQERKSSHHGIYLAEIILAPYLKFSFVRNIFELNLSTGALFDTRTVYPTSKIIRAPFDISPMTENSIFRTQFIANARLTLFFTYIEYSAVMTFQEHSHDTFSIIPVHRLGFGLAFSF